MKTKILVVEDELSISELIKFNLEKSGYEVVVADTGTMALELVEQFTYSLMLLDLMLPGVDGLEVCRKVKLNNKTASLPIIMLTARNEEIDKIIGLELGADDYTTKPFSPRELLARVKAVLRRSAKDPQAEGELVVGPLKINFNNYEIFLGITKLELTPKEYELLKLFMTNIGKAYSREQLLEKIWGYDYYGDTRTVDVHIRHLRVKLEGELKVAEAIETVRGIGYRLRQL